MHNACHSNKEHDMWVSTARMGFLFSLTIFLATASQATQDTIKIGELSNGRILLTVSPQDLADAIIQTEGGGFQVHTLVVDGASKPYIIAYCDDDVARAYECFSDGMNICVFAMGESHSCSGNNCNCCYFLKDAEGTTIVGCGCDTTGILHPFCTTWEDGRCDHSMTSDQSGLVSNLSYILGL
jgi:hypothetical protein